MRKFIQVSALFSAFFAFSAIAANAQSIYSSEVNIPFAFTVGDKTYGAGNYDVKLNKLASGAATLAIVNTDTDEIETVLLTETGETRTRDVKLFFNTENGERFLTGIRTSDNAFAVSKKRSPSRKTIKVGTDIGGGANLF